MIINVKTSSRTEFADITADIQKELSAAGVQSGLCMVYVPHTTAAVTINESADSSEMLKNYKKVKVWQKSYGLCIEI